MRGLLFLLAFSSPFFFLSCGRPFSGDLKEGYTRIFVGGGSSGMLRPLTTPSNTTGEAILFATKIGDPNSTQRRFIFGAGSFPTGGADSPTFWDLPNGTYKFGMIGYDNPSMGVGNADVPICAEGRPDVSGAIAGDSITLNGGTQRIEFTGGACAASSFFKQGQDYSSITLQMCGTGEDLTAAHTTSGGCTLSGITNSTVKAFKVVVTELENNPVSGVGMRSGCILLGGTANSTQNIKYLGGNPGKDLKLKTSLVFWNSTDCGAADSNASLVGGYDFPQGFSEANGTTTSIKGVLPNGTVSAGGDFALWVDDPSFPRLWLRKFF